MLSILQTFWKRTSLTCSYLYRKAGKNYKLVISQFTDLFVTIIYIGQKLSRVTSKFHSIPIFATLYTINFIPNYFLRAESFFRSL